ncbi:glycine cleavage system protein GcvH [Kitasatospora sp. RB6PN24]|uniref:glycine cleavage system protein GcvH n=1 Tax=Kitasatospora humi TaxID=2893891 RepID=UPI001E3EA89C|nr:glycine cleavage system protein GcvH [Kitasatospora humi]MCC9308809.1 glycine cleavage system protein GcvH [Kitasatospora humi]
MYPTTYRYTRDHEWIMLDGKVGTVGLTEFAQKQLGDIVFVDIPPTDGQLEQGEVFGTVESVKSVSDLFLPVAGTIKEVNDELSGEPELINDDAHGTWLIKLQVADPKSADGLLTAEQYEAYIAGE